jgi:hypothetical protein
MGGKTFVITGEVVDRGTGRGMADVRVEAWDKGRTSDESIAGADTDSGGCFRIEFSRHQLREEFRDKNPDLFFKVYRNETLVEDADEVILADQSPKRIKGIVIQVDGARGTGQPPDTPPRPGTQPAVTVHGPQLAQTSRPDLVDVGLALVELRRAAAFVRVAQRLLALAACICWNWQIGAPVKRSLIAYDH